MILHANWKYTFPKYRFGILLPSDSWFFWQPSLSSKRITKWLFSSLLKLHEKVWTVHLFKKSKFTSTCIADVFSYYVYFQMSFIGHIDFPPQRFQMNQKLVYPRGCICLAFSSVYFQMSPQMACLRGCKVTLVAFVWLFSTVYFQMSPQIDTNTIKWSSDG